MTYDRDLLIEVITYHRPGRDASCLCGWAERWAELGHSFPAHVADVYERRLAEREAEKRLGRT